MTPERFIREETHRYRGGVRFNKLQHGLMKACGLSWYEARDAIIQMRDDDKVKIVFPVNHEASVVWKWKT